MWFQSVDDTRRNWRDAKLYCDNLIFAGFSDWWMPTRDEMVTLQRAGGPDYAFGLARKGFKKLKASFY
jgi:hypothetical protein